MDEKRFEAVKELISFAYGHQGETLEADEWNKMLVKEAFYPINGKWKAEIIPEGFLEVTFYKPNGAEVLRTETFKFPK